MKSSRRLFLRIAGAATAVAALSGLALAQSYPARTVRLIVTFPAGSAPDIIARLAGQHLSERLGQQFVIENKPGATGNIGTEYVTKAEPDGYTILLPVSTNAVNVALYRDLNFDFIRDIAPIAGIAKTVFVVVVPPTFPAKTLSEFTTYLKANPAKVNMGSAGIGGSPHVMGELFQLMTGTTMLHVPYRGNFMPDLLAGEVHVVFAPIAQVLTLIRDGKLRALAVTTATRTSTLPDVPAISEFVPSYDAFGWYGLGAPAKTPLDIIQKLGAVMNEVLADGAVKARFSEMGVEPMPLTANEFARHIAGEVNKWAEVIRAQGIQVK
jgi:tripartite-type tricarboxylate transporter receptor subunit TctC